MNITIEDVVAYIQDNATYEDLMMIDNAALVRAAYAMDYISDNMLYDEWSDFKTLKHPISQSGIKYLPVWFQEVKGNEY